MKYATFVKLRALVVALLCGLLFTGMWSGCRARQETVAVTPASLENATPAETAPPKGKPTVSGTADFTDIHREILKMQKSPLSKGEEKGDSLRWLVSDNGIKAEFRSDKSKGSTIWNRVKIDYNSNKQYEEKWDFKPGGSVKRQVAPNDDGTYTEEYRLQGEKWVRK